MSVRTAVIGSRRCSSAQSPVATGAPISTSAWPARNRPGSLMTRPTGSSVTGGAPLASASSSTRAAPVRRVMSAGSGWLTPSGKIRIASPAPSAVLTARKVAALPEVSPPASWRRWTGSARAKARNGAMIGWRNSPDLASGRNPRGRAAISSMGSMSPF